MPTYLNRKNILLLRIPGCTIARKSVTSRSVLASPLQSEGQEGVGHNEAGIRIEFIECLESQADSVGFAVGSSVEDGPPGVIEDQARDLITVHKFVVSRNPHHMHWAGLHDNVG